MQFAWSYCKKEKDEKHIEKLTRENPKIRDWLKKIILVQSLTVQVKKPSN